MSKYIDSQLKNGSTYNMYLRQMISLAENVFEFKNLPEFIDISYLNRTLLNRGSIAFFYDETFESVLALPFNSVNKQDVYGRPTSITVQGRNGYTRTLNNDEFVIMYDNTARYSIRADICQMAERIMLDTRITDINITAQKTPRIISCPAGMEATVKKLINDFDSNVDTIVAYKTLMESGLSIISEPAPFIVDKLDIHKEKDWNEFLRLIGISNISFMKKERQIKDEINAMQGGTIASRFSRFEPRKRAVEEINKKFADYLEKPIEVNYYDGEPTTEEGDDDVEY